MPAFLAVLLNYFALGCSRFQSSRPVELAVRGSQVELRSPSGVVFVLRGACLYLHLVNCVKGTRAAP